MARPTATLCGSLLSLRVFARAVCPAAPVGHQRGERQEFPTAAETDDVTGRAGPSSDADDCPEPVGRNDLLIQYGRTALQ
eukprot:12023617-Alexandrium_andersonii.AAC.2